ISEAVVSHRDLRALIHDLADLLHQVVPFDHLLLGLHDPATNTMRPHVLEASEPLPHELPTSMSVEGCPMGRVWQTQRPLILPSDEEEARSPSFQEVHRLFGSVCILPLTTARRRLGVLGWGSRQAAAYTAADVEFL